MPRLVGTSLAVAQRRLKLAGCAPAKVTRRRAPRARRGRVLSQGKKAGTTVTRTTRVAVVVGR